LPHSTNALYFFQIIFELYANLLFPNFSGCDSVARQSVIEHFCSTKRGRLFGQDFRLIHTVERAKEGEGTEKKVIQK
jgi:hypothetical protein